METKSDVLVLIFVHISQVCRVSCANDSICHCHKFQLWQTSVPAVKLSCVNSWPFLGGEFTLTSGEHICLLLLAG